MAHTKLTVVNSALARLGETPLASAAKLASDSDDNRGRVLNGEWEQALDEFLRAFPWHWAKTRTALTAATGTYLGEWSFQADLPEDIVTLIAINETDVATPGDWWEIESGVLYTDARASDDSVFIEYIYKPSASATDAFIDRMDPLARNALITLLASKIAPAVTKDGIAKGDQLMQRYMQVDLAQARLRTAGERKDPWTSVRTDSAWDNERYAW